MTIAAALSKVAWRGKLQYIFRKNSTSSINIHLCSIKLEEDHIARIIRGCRTKDDRDFTSLMRGFFISIKMMTRLHKDDR